MAFLRCGHIPAKKKNQSLIDNVPGKYLHHHKIFGPVRKKKEISGKKQARDSRSKKKRP